MSPRVESGLRYLGREMSATREEFFAGNGYGSAMLLDGLMGNGYAIQRGHRIALSERGRRALGDFDPAALQG